jgi:hypothetical protein
MNLLRFLSYMLSRDTTEYNGGKAFPKRDEDLKGGRPIR